MTTYPAPYPRPPLVAPILDTAEPGALAGMIRRAFGRYAAKLASVWADVSPRTMEDTLQERRQLGSWRLLRMCRHPAFRAELRAYLDHIEQEEATIALQMEQHRAQRLGGVARDPVTPGDAAGVRPACPCDARAGRARRTVTP